MVTQEQYDDLYEKIKGLEDTLKNGVKYDRENNMYVPCWTRRELYEAKKRAEELSKDLGWHLRTTP